MKSDVNGATLFYDDRGPAGGLVMARDVALRARALLVVLSHGL
jgi:hypothetical protein